ASPELPETFSPPLPRRRPTPPAIRAAGNWLPAPRASPLRHPPPANDSLRRSQRWQCQRKRAALLRPALYLNLAMVLLHDFLAYCQPQSRTAVRRGESGIKNSFLQYLVNSPPFIAKIDANRSSRKLRRPAHSYR